MRVLFRQTAWLAILYAPLAMTQAVAQPPVPASLMGCAEISGDPARLACFDRELAKLAPKGSIPAVSASAQGLNALPVPLTAEQKLGLSKQRINKLEPKTAESQESEFHAHIARASNDGVGHLLFVLDNAQIWRQVDSDSTFLVRSGDTVTISPGALGSFWFSVNGRPAIKAKRLQ